MVVVVVQSMCRTVSPTHYYHLYLGGYYRPPEYKLQDFLFALDHDLVNCKKVDTFILGDFNVNMCEQNNECTMYNVIYRSTGFKILNALPIRINNTIDHVMTNTTQKNTIKCNIENTLILTTIYHSSYGEKPQNNQECIVINYIKVANLLKTKLGNLTVENKDTDPNKHLEYILG
ncbi:hypothetical protein PR048_001716 [Dryococelus australis]|uniref:Endonuclease/exonuclease/phosphatase domain-containing protein n=1 Tax=Dryococelus australis TaxID=614101 RepID=A0ABQ9II35_9NEOP|nr:hypothetical protein PR048_001716 [Dryococelus australis]